MWRFYVPGGRVLCATGEEVRKERGLNDVFLSLFYCIYKIIEESFGTEGTLIFGVVLFAILTMLGA